MSLATLSRLSGLALILAGLLSSPGPLLHPDYRSVRDVLDAAAYWVPLHVVAMLAFFLTSVGFIGLYARQASKMGWLGLGGLVLTVAGISLMMGFAFTDAFVVPILAVRAPTLADPANLEFVFRGIFPVIAGGFAGYILGHIALGIATLRAGILPRLSGPLLTLGPLLWIALASLRPVGTLVGTAVLALAYILPGYWLWGGSIRQSS